MVEEDPRVRLHMTARKIKHSRADMQAHGSCQSLIAGHPRVHPMQPYYAYVKGICAPRRPPAHPALDAYLLASLHLRAWH